MRPVLSILVVFLVGCGPAEPRLETAADSLAYRVTEATGGLSAWESLPALAWEWAVVQDSAERVRTYHLWDKRGDRARVEWPVGADSVAVAVLSPSQFDPEQPEGDVAVNGVALAGEDRAERLVEAHRRFVNDGYWLLAPLKTLDPGVRRAVDTTSVREALALSFEGVGLTPGDRYWLDVDPVSGAMTGWTYQLEGSDERARWEWLDPVDVPTPEGPLRLATLKVKDGEGTVILTEPTAVVDVDETAFADLSPRAGRLDGGAGT
jgi:hypothetical protein